MANRSPDLISQGVSGSTPGLRATNRTSVPTQWLIKNLRNSSTLSGEGFFKQIPLHPIPSLFLGYDVDPLPKKHRHPSLGSAENLWLIASLAHWLIGSSSTPAHWLRTSPKIIKIIWLVRKPRVRSTLTTGVPVLQSTVRCPCEGDLHLDGPQSHLKPELIPCEIL